MILTVGLKKLREENEDVKKSLASMKKDYSKLKDALTEERTALETQMEDLKAENLGLKNNSENEGESRCDHETIDKYKEFLSRAQAEYKSVENERKKENEKHKAELENLSLKRIETEEKYGQVLKERELVK